MLGKIVNEIKKLVNNGIDANITEETSLVELGIDSLMTVELVLWLEDAFNIQFNDSDLEMENLRNVRDIVNLVNKYIEQC
ncbi:phosphopantetheine-binding protein [[Bacteroides] pectinophilus]|uniref:Carrier domain-containing protein n=1 Tax=[Bacteroides] pectinophilus ATCC 43243 TaxID=483218 RepID=B7ANI1_9FIRM|nr:putative acyl carrier protein [[Bacteroides] pectinophilus ATCC 43243]UWN96481.1 phosphopantetheine-binding protein [[Bacteroides] pectinophilus]